MKHPLSLRRLVAWLAVAGIGFLLGGCAGMAPKAGASRGEIESWAGANGYRAEAVAAPPYRLFSLLRQRRPDPLLVVYIDGDSADKPSVYRPRDPTPKTAHALQLAHLDTAPMVAYLGRPCQYPDGRNGQPCDAQLFVEPRYSAEIIDAMNVAVSELKRRSGAERIGLVGYAGGGVIATLLAMKRDDVAELITVVAPLAFTDWAATYRLTPFWTVLDPIAQPAFVREFPATHFVGGNDDIVPPEFTASFVARYGGQLVLMDNFSHDCCWANEWPWLLERARGQLTAP